MAIFSSKKSAPASPLAQLKTDPKLSPADQQRLVREVLSDESVRAKDVAWALASKRPELRRMGLQVLKRSGGDLSKTLIAEFRDKSEGEQKNLIQSVCELDQEVVTAVLEWLRSDDNRRARSLLGYLIRHAPFDKVKGALSRLAADATGEVRVAAIARLREDPSMLRSIGLGAEAIRAMVDHHADDLRKAGYELAASLDGEVFDGILVQGLGDNVPTIRKQVAAHIEKRVKEGDAAMTRALMELLGDGRHAVRSTAVDLLTKVPDTQEVVRSYLVATKGAVGWMRDRALDSLKVFGDALVDPIINLMMDSDREVRLMALLVGASFEDPRCVQPIMSLLDDEDWWTRLTAVETLGRSGDKQCVTRLIEMLDDQDCQWAVIEALGALGDDQAIRPLARFLKHEAVPVRLAAIDALSGFEDPRVLKALTDRLKHDDAQIVRDRCVEVVRSIAARQGRATDRSELETLARQKGGEQTTNRLDRLLIEVRRRGGSDLHIAVGLPALMRVGGALERAPGGGMEEEEVKDLLYSILTPRQQETLEKDLQLDFCYAVPEVGRYRANIFLQRRGYGGIFRVIPGVVPTFSDIGLPDHVAQMKDFHQGMIIVAGPASSGKSTTLAALVNLLNEEKRAHILSLEEPVEFVHMNKQSLVNQREVGKHTQSFANALRGALREDPDVIVVGDMRDPEVIRMALEASETGHLVIGTLNTTSAPQTVDRIIDSFPPNEQQQVRLALSESLQIVVSQRLLPRMDGQGQVACFEILLATSSVRNMIRDDKTFQLGAAMQMGKTQGNRTADMAMQELVQKRLLSPEDAYIRAKEKSLFENMVGADFLAEIQRAGAGQSDAKEGGS
ncbi:MAG: PilT/PilU family type 4a pilus ATPase [Myxococcota bacterium]|nr:PilT/PilU family type 4a pilus ATPase [Myxococcota bacterium]